MTKEWVENKNKEYAQKFTAHREKIIKIIKSNNLLDENKKESIIKDVDKEETIVGLQTTIFISAAIADNEEEENNWKKLAEELDLDTYSSMLRYPDYYNGNLYKDSEPVRFNGDIIITDPCYIRKEDETNTDEEKTKNNIFHPYMEHDTIYGDWSCTTYDTNTEKELGHFCADSGMVGVYLLSDVLAYNPDFNYHLERPHTTTWIHNFDGTVQFVITEHQYKYNNENCIEYSLSVIGHGINSQTGEAIDFITMQTGL